MTIRFGFISFICLCCVHCAAVSTILLHYNKQFAQTQFANTDCVKKGFCTDV